MGLPRKLPRPEFLLAFLALLGACHAADPGGARARTSVPEPLVDTTGNLAAFRALQAALAEGEDELAAGILGGLRGRALSRREAELLDSAEHVLAGRALVRTLALRLESEPDPERSGAYRLILVARSEHLSDVRLDLPPCSLKHLRASIDSRGLEGLELESRASSVLSGLELAPTVERRIEVLRYELPLGRALGVRERWRLETRNGEIRCAGQAYPAAQVRVEGCERERLSPLLPGEPSLAAALAAALDASEAPSSRALLELALRTPQAEREEALRALAPVVTRLARQAPERVVAAEPALRWLTENRDLGPDAQAWARYLDLRATMPAAPPGAPRGGLDLPMPRGGGEGT